MDALEWLVVVMVSGVAIVLNVIGWCYVRDIVRIRKRIEREGIEGM